jgi:RNA polymerase sigma-70 factor (ECF subfamily)
MGRELPALDTATDEAVIFESVSKPQVFSAIFDRHFHVIYSYLAKRAGTQVAEDLASLTFTVAFERRTVFARGAGSARPWLFGIANNLLHNRRRSEQRLSETAAAFAALSSDGEVAPGAPGPRGAAFEDAQLARALATLEVSYRDVLLLYAWGELTYEEIAVALAIPVGTVRSRLSRARSQLRRELADGALSPLSTVANDQEQEQL